MTSSIIDRWHREIDQLFNETLDASRPAVPNSSAWMPSVDLEEENDRFVLRADGTGVAPGGIEVSAKGQPGLAAR